MALTKIDDRGLKTPVDLLDNEKIRFGTGNDLEIYHDGSNSIISDAGTGGLEIQSNGTGIYLQKSASEYLAKFLTDGSVELYYDNSKKFETTSTGLLMTGNAHGIELKSASANSGNFIKFSDHDTSDDGRIQYEHSTNEFLFKAEGSWRTRLGTTYLKPETTNVFDLGTDSQRFKDVYVSNDIDLLDDGKLLIGTGDDLQIYHDGSHSYIRDTGTGMLSIDGSQINLHNAAGSEYMLQAVENGAVSLYYDNSKKLETYNGGVEVFGDCSLGDDKVLNIGTGSDLQIKHDGSNSIINQTGTGTLRIQQDETNHWEFGDSFLKGNDNREIILGDSSDLKIYHNGTDSRVISASNDLFIYTTGDNAVKLLTNSENAVICNPNGVVDLYCDNQLKFSTHSSGVQLHGDSKFKHDGWRGLLDRSWSDYPGIGISPDTTYGTNTEFRLHGDSASNLGYLGGGADFALVVRTDGSFEEGSDRRRKSNIEEITGALAIVKQLTGKKFNIINREGDIDAARGSKKQYGLIAQECKDIIPEVVHFHPDEDTPNENGWASAYGLDYGQLTPLLINAVKELSTAIDTLNTKVAALEAA